MTDVALYFAIVMVAGLVFLPLHIVAVRARGGDKLITTFNAAVAASTAVAVAIGWFALGDLFSSPEARTLACVSAGLSFAACAGLYGVLGPISVDRSVSVHIVSLISLAPGHRLTEGELLGYYPHSDIVAKRFHDCLETGIVRRDGTAFVLTPKGKRIARLYAVMGQTLGMHLWYLDRLKTGTKPAF